MLWEDVVVRDPWFGDPERVRRLRLVVGDRDGWRCRRCGALEPGLSWCLDHVGVPRRVLRAAFLAGQISHAEWRERVFDPAGVVLSCWACNSGWSRGTGKRRRGGARRVDVEPRATAVFVRGAR